MLASTLGPCRIHENLAVYPILAEEAHELGYSLMAEALALGTLTIREKNGGQVPWLLATNSGPHPILIMDGEQLIGAKQNRVTNRSILLEPQSITEIPVSCMEHGRWHFTGQDFETAPQHAPTKVRRKARDVEVQASYHAERRGPHARPSHRELARAQGEVWEEIHAFGRKLGGISATGALDSLYRHRRRQLGTWLEAFPVLPNQIGIVALASSTGLRKPESERRRRSRIVPLGLDTLGSAVLWAKVHQRILTGYILDAMERLSPWPEAPDDEFDPDPTISIEVGPECDPAHPQSPAEGQGRRRGRHHTPEEDDPGRRPGRRGPSDSESPRGLSAAAEEFVAGVRRAERRPSDSVGLGQYYILRGSAVGGELVHEGRLVHLSAFPLNGHAGPRRGQRTPRW